MRSILKLQMRKPTTGLLRPRGAARSTVWSGLGDSLKKGRRRFPGWWKKRLSERTLVRAARAERRKKLRLSRRERLSELWERTLRQLSHPATLFVLSLGVGVGILFVPTSASFGAVRDSKSAQSFLSTLWQVEAGAIALSLTLILVGFEAIWRTRFRGSFRRFTDEFWLLYAIATSLASLVTIGVVLLGYGQGAPGGWAATWAICLAGIAFFVTVPLVLTRTLFLMNPTTVHERRLQQIRAEVDDAVDNEAFEQLATSILGRRSEEAGIVFAPALRKIRIIFPGRAPGVAIKAPRAGVITNIKLGVLERVQKEVVRKEAAARAGAARGAVPSLMADGRAADAAERARQSGLSIVVTPGHVARGDVLAFGGNYASPRQQRQIRRAFRIDARGRSTRLYDVIGQVHEQALRAIREAQPSTYEDITQLWIELLSAAPRAWRRYGYRFEKAIGESGLAGPRLIDEVARNLNLEAREATRGTSDIAAASFSVPEEIATRTLDLDAPALVERMLSLYPSFYRLAADVSDQSLQQRLVELVFELPTAFGRRVGIELEALIRQQRPSEWWILFPPAVSISDPKRAGQLLRIVCRSLTELMKAVVEHDPHQISRLKRLNSLWSKIFDRAEWEEHERELKLYRDECLLGLSVWVLNRLEQTRDSVWRDVLDVLLPCFGSVETTAEMSDAPINVSPIDIPFWKWHDPMGIDLERGIFVFTLLKHGPEEIRGSQDLRRFFSDHAEQTLEQVRADAELWALLKAPTDLHERVEALRTEVRGADRNP
jgi:hypothetical protein